MKQTEKLSFGLLLYGYAVLLGAAYLFAFWRPFGFNIFPYASPTDFVTFPLNRLSALLAPLVLLLVIPMAGESNRLPKLPFYAFVAAIIVHIGFAIAHVVESIQMFALATFFFTNEKSVLAFCVLFIAISLLLTYQAIRDRAQIHLQVLALVLAQISLVMASGYDDGKTIFNGADHVFFLEQRELCEKPALRDWVYLAKFGSNAFFLNTIDKRICVLDKIQFNLVSRKFQEGL